MKKYAILLMVLFLLTLLPSCGGEEGKLTMELDGKEYTLTFQDDFSGKKLNTKKWSLCPEWQRQDVGGYWSEDMVSVSDGVLHLKADVEGETPVSGAIRSRDKFSQRLGYFEASVKLQNTSGFWGAFWLMDPDMKEEAGNGAVDGAEVDIMESFDIYSGGINHAIHWDGYNTYHDSVSYSLYNPDLYEGYHTYGLLWTEEEYIFYIDGEETWRTSLPGCCDHELYLKLTTEFGSWASYYVEEQLPDEVTVDWVRVWQSNDVLS